uniref:ThiF domain-containing protein n=1 Tax=Angiostrongylus cantonensis TaxID=6313 RepID=A0A0K0D3W5_ANGCA
MARLGASRCLIADSLICAKYFPNHRKIEQFSFIACSVFGWMGYSFFDFNNHRFVSAVIKKGTVDWVGEGDGGTSASETVVDVDAEHNQLEELVMQYPRFEEAFNVDWSKKQLIRKSKRLIPCSYFPLKAMLRAQKEKILTENEDVNVNILIKLWCEEVLLCNHDVEKQSVKPDEFDYFFGPQISPVCSIIGGFVGQEAVKALSEGGRPLKNIFIYSAIDTTGIVCDFPPSD